MFTNNLKKIVDKRKKRLGRGVGSGKGKHTVGRGQKGQTSRSGYHKKRAFEGGQVPLSRRLPVIKGNKSHLAKSTAINIGLLLQKGIFEVDAAALQTLTKSTNIKLVGSSDYNEADLKKVVIKNDVKLSNSLKEKITSNGGKVEE